jgi:hypothetical protein
MTPQELKLKKDNIKTALQLGIISQTEADVRLENIKALEAAMQPRDINIQEERSNEQ